ncbi:MAG TPA: hypothetical protein PLG41_02530 [Leptospiraceae bacterium]|nr:hypothetical protein [Leptospiraceae bacterium]
MKYLFLFCFLVLSNLAYADALPDTMPEDIVIRYYKPLGHAGRGFSMEMSVKNCKYKDQFIQKENEFSFNLTSEELRAIYRSFVKNKLNRIENADDMMHDYDGVSLSVSWKGGSVDVSQSGSRIKSNWQKEWDNIITPLYKIKEREYIKALSELQLNLDKSLLNSFFHLQSDSSAMTIHKYIDESTLKENPIRIKTLPGIVSIQCTLYKGYDLKKKAEIYADFDPERSSLWDNKHNEYLNSLKQETFYLTLDFKTKKVFQVIRKGDKIQIQ